MASQLVRLPNERDALRELAQSYISKETIREAIGEDDYITNNSGNSRFDQQVQSNIDGANTLRRELRSKLLKEGE